LRSGTFAAGDNPAGDASGEALPIYSPEPYRQPMVDSLPLDRYDTAVLAISAAILAVAYSPVSTHLFRITAWLVVFTLSVGWLTFFAWKVVYDVEP
jgi:hypothetical protein